MTQSVIREGLLTQLIPFFSGEKVKGWPARAGRAQRTKAATLPSVLSTRHSSDVFFVQYGVASHDELALNEGYRYRVDSLEHVAVPMVSAVFDVDSPAKKIATPGEIDFWFDTERPKITALLRDYPGALAYRTRGGYRIVYSIPSTTLQSKSDAASWRESYLAACERFEAEWGIKCDRACGDFTHLFRAPFVVRTEDALAGNTTPREVETWGEIVAGAFDMYRFPRACDRDAAKRKNPKATPRPKKDLPPRAFATLHGACVWEQLLAKRGLLREDRGHNVIIECPNRARHSSESATESVLYRPDAGDIYGRIHCFHQGCLNADFKSDLGVTEEEWKAAVDSARGPDVSSHASPGALDSSPPDASREPGDALDWLEGLAADHDGSIWPTPANVALVLAKHPEWLGGPALDTWRDVRIWPTVPVHVKSVTRGHLGAGNPVHAGSDASAVQDFCTRDGLSWKSKPARDACALALEYAADRNPYDSLLVHVNSFRNAFDGVERLDTWLIDWFGAPDLPYVRRVSRAWMLSAFARALIPGCVADGVLLLESEDQSVGKTAGLLHVFGKSLAHVVYPGTDLESKETAYKLARSWIVILDEFKIGERKLETFKSWVSDTELAFRRPYASAITELPRRFAICGTTNNTESLEDAQNRRIWPVAVTRGVGIDRALFGAIDRGRASLFAEALAVLERRGNEMPWLIRTEDPIWGELNVARESREAIRASALWDRIVSTVRENPETREWSVAELIEKAGYDATRQDRALEMNIAVILRKIGYEKVKVHNGLRRWVRM